MNSYVDNPITDSQTILSIASGQQGIERGIEIAGTPIRVAAYVEIETFIIANLVGLMEQGVVAPAPIWADLKTFDATRFRGKIHGITAGYPCQPFSNAGHRRGTDDPRHLFPYIERTIIAAQPLWCFFENVEGHLSLGFDTVYKSLRDLGYAVEEGIFSAKEVGAPHTLKRLFILAVKLGYAQHLRQSARAQQGSDGPPNDHSEKRPQMAEQYEGTNKLEDTHKFGIQRGFSEHIPLAKRCEIQIERSGELDNTHHGRPQQSPDQVQARGHASEYASEGKLEHPASGRPRGLQNPPSEGQGHGAGGRSELLRGNESMADPSSFGSQGNGSEWNGAGQAGLYGGERNHQGWPAPPGHPQYYWEHPRSLPPTIHLPPDIPKIWRKHGKDFKKMLGAEAWQEIDDHSKSAIESGMGSTIDGYNFREDLLRMFGNGVVDKTAATAWPILWNKIITGK